METCRFCGGPAPAVNKAWDIKASDHTETLFSCDACDDRELKRIMELNGWV